MRRALQLLGLSAILVTGFASNHALADDPSDADAQAETKDSKDTAEAAPAAQAAAAVEPAPTPAVPTPDVAKPKFGDVSTHGYFRGGFGLSSEKGRQTCFKLSLEGGLISKYRLGNECEVWAEMEFRTIVYAGDDGTVASVHFTPTAFIPNSRIGYPATGVTSSDLGSPGTGATVAFPNLYADIQGIPWLFGGTAWVGTRYYKRESIYISDFFYWNPSGVGAGIEDIHLGKDLRLSIGEFAVDGQPKGTPQLPMQVDLGLRHDVQLRGIKPYPSGEIQVGFQYITNFTNKSDPQNGNAGTTGGWGITVQHVQDVLGGNNKFAVQYGRGGGTGFGTLSRFYYPDFSIYWSPNEARLRFVDVLTIQPLPFLGAQANFVFQHDDQGIGTTGLTDWVSAGTRVSLAVAKHAKVLGEVGYDRVKKGNGADPQSLLKLTVAPTLTTDRGFWARPELRLFYTWAMWNESARGAHIDSADVYLTTQLLSGSTAGLQAEAMW